MTDTRASMCMLTQGVTFDRVMKKKGDVLVEAGLLPRMLMSFCTDGSAHCRTVSHQWRCPASTRH